MAGTSISLIDKLKIYLDELFTIKELGFAKYVLGMEIARIRHGLFLAKRNTSGIY